MRWLLIQELVGRGVYTLGAFLLCYRHSRRDLERLGEAFQEAMAVVRRALEMDSVEGLLHPGVHRAMGSAQSLYTWRSMENAVAVADGDDTLYTVARLACALHHFRAGAADRGSQYLAMALAEPLGLDPRDLEAEERPLTDRLRELLAAIDDPAAFSFLANLALLRGEFVAAERFFRRYLELGAQAEDRDKVEATLIELAAGNRLGCRLSEAGGSDPENLQQAEAAILEIDPGLDPGTLRATNGQVVQSHLPRVLDCRHGITLVSLGRLRHARADLETAEMLFRRAAERFPGTPVEETARR